MDVEQNEVVIVLDRGMEPEELAAEGTCCKGRPSASATVSVDR
jgi:hypothetical protein